MVTKRSHILKQTINLMQWFIIFENFRLSDLQKKNNAKKLYTIHCAKRNSLYKIHCYSLSVYSISLRIQSVYSVSLRIQSMYAVSLLIQTKCGKIWTRKNPNTDTFYAVILSRTYKDYQRRILGCCNVQDGALCDNS